MRAGIFATPRPVPGRLIPALGGLLILLLALPLFLIADWDLAGWAQQAGTRAGQHLCYLTVK